MYLAPLDDKTTYFCNKMTATIQLPLNDKTTHFCNKMTATIQLSL